jgi:hypothetical protein
LLSSIFAFLVQQDLKRLDIDDVRNSEYIEEDVIRKYSID